MGCEVQGLGFRRHSRAMLVKSPSSKLASTTEDTKDFHMKSLTQSLGNPHSHLKSLVTTSGLACERANHGISGNLSGILASPWKSLELLWNPKPLNP